MYKPVGNAFMKTVRTLGRLLLPASLVLLAACQSMPAKKTTAETSAPVPPAETTVQAQRQGAPIAVFLADTATQSGWTPVAIQSGTLYVNPQPIITREDLSGIQAGSNKQGEGLLALELNESGKSKIVDITTKNPNKRLALVVGRTMMAAPGYTSPVTTGHLIFAVGTEQNATAAARAVAGVEDNGAATSPVNPGGPQSGSPATGATPSGGGTTNTGTSGQGTSGTGASGTSTFGTGSGIRQ
jgi:preprotein translocase subunit SecD